MKIVSYNISYCTQKKLDELYKLKADIYIIPEMAKYVKIPDGYFMKFVGEYLSKGLGIVFNNPYVPSVMMKICLMQFLCVTKIFLFLLSGQLKLIRMNLTLIQQSFELKSVYHELRGESFGNETKKTYFHQFKEDNPFFLDYAYYTYKTLQIKNYELLPWDKDFSDHRGQVIEF